MDLTNESNALPGASLESRLPYWQPTLVRFGHVADLTTAGSGGVAEDKNGTGNSCSKNKQRVASACN